MPEPNTLTPPPDGPDPPAGSTTAWAQVAVPAPDRAPGATRTLPPRSTPGPDLPDQATAADASVGAGGDLPRIAGLRVEKLIGRGGMGRVYRATHLELNKVIALKLITTAGRDEDAVRGRFEREVQALARIDHPNIVPVYHAGQWHGFPYFTMKFVPGGALSQHLQRFTGNPEACVRLVAKVARAVQALHNAGVVHRDLKPLNILLGDHDEPLVADFGLAKWLDDPASDLTITHVPLGTRQYMAPEQTLGLRGGYSPACDIWALGVTLYELLAGVRPFPDDGSSDLYERIRTADPPPLPESVPSALASVIDRCLAKKPEERYPTAAAVADDLDRWVAGEVLPAAPVRTRPAPLWARALGVCGLMALIVLPAMLIPWGRAEADPEKQPPPHAVRALTVSEEVRAGRVVRLTDAKGKPLVPMTRPPGRDLFGTENQAGDYVLFTLGMGIGELVDEVLPLPIRVDADVEVTVGAPGEPVAGVYVAGRQWPGKKVTGRSLVRFTVSPDFGPGDNATLVCAAQGYWWAHEDSGTKIRMGLDTSIPIQKPADGVWKTTVSVEVYPDRLIPTFHGKQFGPVAGDKLLAEIRNELRMPQGRDKPDDFVIVPPAFGTGIGITVDSAQVVIRNMTLTPLRK